MCLKLKQLHFCLCGSRPESNTLLNDLEAVSSSNLSPLASEKALIGCHHCLAELLFMANMMLKKRQVVLGTPQCIKANMMKGDRLNLKRATATSTRTLAVKEYSMSVLRHISQWVTSGREQNLLFLVCKSKRPARSTEKKPDQYHLSL